MTRAEIDALVAEVGDALLRRIRLDPAPSAPASDAASVESKQPAEVHGWPAGVDLATLADKLSAAALNRSCQTAVESGRRAVQAPAGRIALVARALRGSSLPAAARCCSPWGAAPAPVAMLEAELALAHGAGEIVLTADAAALIDSDLERVFSTMAGVRRLAAGAGAAMTVALPVAMLDERSCLAGAALAQLAGASGLQLDLAGSEIAADRVVRLARQVVGEKAPIAVSGAAAPLQTLRSAGADRLVLLTPAGGRP